MRRLSSLASAAILLPLLLFAACDDRPGATKLPPVASALAGPVQPWDTMAPGSIYGATAAENLRVVPVDLDLLGIPARWEGMRIAVLSDLQLGLWEENEAVATAATKRAAGLGADLVVLLGDYLATGSDTATLARVLAPLRGKRALAVLGDRDLRSDSLALGIARTLSAQGIQVLRNGSTPFVFKGDTATILGIEADLAKKPEADQAWILSQLGGKRVALLLTHVPQLAARAPEGRFPGVLAGNTFCGRVEVPGTPRLAWLAATALPGAAVPSAPRLFRLDTSVMFVSCGLGYGFVPARFGAPPEIALVTLHPVLADQAGPATTDSLSVDTLILRFERRDTAAAKDSTE